MTTPELIIAGTILGLTAGISPGPLLALVITESLKYGRREGIKVAVSPLITDPPIILASFLILSKITENEFILGIISLAGGAFIAYLAYESLRTKGLDSDGILTMQQPSLKKGIISNFLNPHPYLFWLTVGTPYMIRALQTGIYTLILFLFSFYMMLTGSKIIIAVITGGSKKIINQKVYVVIMRLLGTALLIFSIIFFSEGIRYLI